MPRSEEVASESFQEELNQLMTSEANKIDQELVIFRESKVQLEHLTRCVNSKLESLMAAKARLELALTKGQSSTPSAEPKPSTSFKAVAEIQTLEPPQHNIRVEPEVKNISENPVGVETNETRIDPAVIHVQVNKILDLIQKEVNSSSSAHKTSMATNSQSQIEAANRKHEALNPRNPSRTPSFYNFQLSPDRSSVIATQKNLRTQKNTASVYSNPKADAMAKLPLPTIEMLANGTAPLPTRPSFRFESLNRNPEVDRASPYYAMSLRKQKRLEDPKIEKRANVSPERLRLAIHKTREDNRNRPNPAQKYQIQKRVRSSVSEIINYLANNEHENRHDQNLKWNDKTNRDLEPNHSRVPPPTLYPKMNVPSRYRRFESVSPVSADLLANDMSVAPAGTGIVKKEAQNKTSTSTGKNLQVQKSQSDSGGWTWKLKKTERDSTNSKKFSPVSTEMYLKYGNFPKMIQQKQSFLRSSNDVQEVQEPTPKICPEPTNLPHLGSMPGPSSTFPKMFPMISTQEVTDLSLDNNTPSKNLKNSST